MDSNLSAVTKIDDLRLIELIGSARKRLVFMTPGMSKEVAEAFSYKWQELGAQSAIVIIDADPEVCRMGYGTLDAITLLHKKAKEINGVVNQQPGIRIALLIVDDITIVYSPPPLLIEAGGKTPDQPNAIALDFVPPKVAAVVCRGGTGLNRLNDSRWVGIQGRRPMPSNCSKCLSKAKPLFSLRDLMMEKLVQSAKLKSLMKKVAPWLPRVPL